MTTAAKPRPRSRPWDTASIDRLVELRTSLLDYDAIAAALDRPYYSINYMLSQLKRKGYEFPRYPQKRGVDAGQPRVGQIDSESVFVRLPRSLIAWLDQQARVERRTRGGMIRFILEEVWEANSNHKRGE